MNNKNTFKNFSFPLLCFLVLVLLGWVKNAAFAFLDSDQDGLSDQSEISLKLDPYKYDTDGGGVGDGAEVLLDKTDPLNSKDDLKKDQDRDGLADSDELVLGTSTTSKDTDADGLSDYSELQFNSLGYVKDSDNDGLNDEKEKAFHTDPLNWDSDQDGVSDGAEILIDGTDALDKNSFIAQDTDKDGLTDAEEVIFGTEKNNPDTDGDGYEDAVEIGKGYNPNGTGLLDYQKILTGKGDARLEGVESTAISIDRISLLVPYTASTNNQQSPDTILLIEGTAPALVEGEIFIYSNQSEAEVFKDAVSADLSGKWIKRIDQALPADEYIVYAAVLTSQGKILAKSPANSFSVEPSQAAASEPTTTETPEIIQAVDEDQNTQAEEKTRNWKLIIGLPILLIIMGAGGFALFKLSQGGKKDEEEIEVPVPANEPENNDPVSASRETEKPQPANPSNSQPQQLKDISGQVSSTRGPAPSNLPTSSSESTPQGISQTAPVKSSDNRSKLQDLAKRIR